MMYTTIREWKLFLESVYISELPMITTPLSDVQGREIGSGNYHTVYEHKTDKNKVVRVSEDGMNAEEYKHFAKYPDKFPIVYGVNTQEEFAILEKLNTAEVGFDLGWIEVELENEGWDLTPYNSVDNMGLVTFDIFHNLEKFKSVVDKQTGDGDRLIAQMYYDFLKWLHDTEKNPFLLDVNDNNFGYDEQGRLKMLDI